MDGYKSYIIAAFTALGSVAAYMQGTLDGKELVAALVAAAALASTKSAIAKTAPKE